MKRSNRIFICLIVAVYLVPFLVYGIYCIFPERGTLVGAEKECRVIQIDNPSLTADDVIIFTPSDDRDRLTASRAYVYYQGKNRYAAETERKDDVLRIGLPEENGEEENLTLHIRLKHLEKVRLNGKTIWPD